MKRIKSFKDSTLSKKRAFLVAKLESLELSFFSIIRLISCEGNPKEYFKFYISDTIYFYAHYSIYKDGGVYSDLENVCISSIDSPDLDKNLIYFDNRAIYEDFLKKTSSIQKKRVPSSLLGTQNKYIKAINLIDNEFERRKTTKAN